MGKKLKGTGSVFEVGGRELNEAQKSFQYAGNICYYKLYIFHQN